MYPPSRTAPPSSSLQSTPELVSTALHNVTRRGEAPVLDEKGLYTAADTARASGPVRHVRRGRGRGRLLYTPAVLDGGRREGGMAHQRPCQTPHSGAIIRPEILYNGPPITARPGIICDEEQVDKCVELLLDLLGWGVPMEYLADLGFSLPGVIWLCAKLKLRLSWGIVLRAYEARIPFHPLSIMPHGYHHCR